jgi:hypothetical protein
MSDAKKPRAYAALSAIDGRFADECHVQSAFHVKPRKFGAYREPASEGSEGQNGRTAERC